MRHRLDKATARVDTARARLAADPTHPRLQHRLTVAEADHAQIRALYDATPGGQDELRAAVAAATDSHDRHALTERLRDAENLRAEQTEAWRRARTAATDTPEISEEDTPMYDEPMTQQRREKFWRQYGWSPDLPQEKRTAIEQRWTDPKIVEAEALGF